MAEPTTTASAEAQTEQNKRPGLVGRIVGTRFIGQALRVVAIPILIYVGIFALAVWRALVDPAGSAEYFAYLRDLFTIALTLTGITIFVGIAILIVQIARFVNLLRSEIKPITRDTREAIKNVRTTSEFVQKQAVEPIIRSQSFFFGLIAFLREIVRISRILRRRPERTKTDE